MLRYGLSGLFLTAGAVTLIGGASDDGRGRYAVISSPLSVTVPSPHPVEQRQDHPVSTVTVTASSPLLETPVVKPSGKPKPTQPTQPSETQPTQPLPRPPRPPPRPPPPPPPAQKSSHVEAVRTLKMAPAMTLQQRAILLDMSTARQLIVDDKPWMARRILINATSHVMYRPETEARISDAIHALDRGDVGQTMRTIDFVLATGADS